MKTKLPFILIFFSIFLSFSCEMIDIKRDYKWPVPFPSDDMIDVIQETVEADSAMNWWTEPHQVIAAYLNQGPFAAPIKKEDVKILSRTMMAVTAEFVFKEDKIKLTIEMKRAIPAKVEKSIFQIVKVTKEKW
ncbi:MAG: hypothetical protein GY855_01360 [candidate division Zixibacteria bacterium]|nr:hypothetical protein [candidate division Zixibacteria bacterium]